MNVLLPLWVTLILFSCYGNIRSDDGQEEEEATSMAFPDSSVTPTPDYDYDNATFDYYLVTFNQSQNLTEEEETTTIQDSSVTPTPEYDYDYNATFDYYLVTFNQSQNLTEVTIDPQQVRDGCRSLRHQSWIISTLLVSLAAFSL